MAKQRTTSSKSSNGANLGFEAKLWAAADKLRGHMDAAEYKHVVLGLIFLKYISDAFEEKHSELLRQKAKDKGIDPEDRDEYLAENIFWVPKQARWSFIQGKAKQTDIGKVIDDAMTEIEKKNPQLKGVLSKDYARPALDKQRLGELIDLIGTIGLGDRENRSKDILGRVYEYLLDRFTSEAPMIPFLKWPGGKRWFVARYGNALPRNYSRYIEPFLGGGSVFFFLNPASAMLSDSNSELISAYLGLREEKDKVEDLLRKHSRRHNKRYYYTIRNSSPRTLAGKAARFIYLNRTCFNGIYRVNLDGEFNVPKGTKDTVLLETDDFSAISSALQKTKLLASDFEPVINEAGANDFIFIDPPYTVRHNNNGFIKYNEVLFSWQDQLRLANSVTRARDRGARVIATNANHKEIRELYSSRGFGTQTVSRFSSISAAGISRRQFEEILIDSEGNAMEGIWEQKQ